MTPAVPLVTRLCRKGAKALAVMLILASALCCTSGVIADVRPGLTAEGGLAVADNPLLIRGSDRGAAVMDAGIRPSVAITDATGLDIEASGLLAGRFYSRRYKDIGHGNARLTADWRKNEWLTLSAEALYNREPMVDRLASDIEASVNSAGVRTSRFGRVSLIWSPDARTRIQPEMSFEKAQYPLGTGLRDTRATMFGLAATRRTSAYTTLGVRWGHFINRVDAAPDSKVYSAYGTLDERLSEVWRLRGEVGLEHIRSSPFQSIPADRRTQMAGRIELCRDSSRLNLCAGGVLTSEVSGLGGLQRRFDLVTTARWRLSPRLNMAFEGRYQRASLQRSPLPNLDSGQARVRLERRVNRRLTASAVAEYRRREPLSGGALSSTTVGFQLKYEALPL